jgi:hypothetical protein
MKRRHSIDALITVQTSTVLADWSTSAILLSEKPTLTRTATPFRENVKQFMRLRAGK